MKLEIQENTKFLISNFQFLYLKLLKIQSGVNVLTTKKQTHECQIKLK